MVLLHRGQIILSLLRDDAAIPGTRGHLSFPLFPSCSYLGSQIGWAFCSVRPHDIYSAHEGCGAHPPYPRFAGGHYVKRGQEKQGKTVTAIADRPELAEAPKVRVKGPPRRQVVHPTDCRVGEVTKVNPATKWAAGEIVLTCMAGERTVHWRGLLGRGQVTETRGL